MQSAPTEPPPERSRFLPQAGATWTPHRRIEWVVDPRTKFAIAIHEMRRNQRNTDPPLCLLSEKLSQGYMRYLLTQQQLERVVDFAYEKRLLP